MRHYILKGAAPVKGEALPVLLRAKGESLKLHRETSYTPPPDQPKRGIIKGFSKASRRRLLYKIAECGKALPIFITLTYGKEWPDAADSKADLRRWWKRVRRQYENDHFGAIWKLEFQKRGAPHFHLLNYRSDGRKPWMCKDWIAQSWAEVTGDTSSEHVNAGTRVESIRTHHGAKFYAAKYLGKESSDSGAHAVGRVWGALSSGNLPVKIEDFWLTPMEAQAFRHYVLTAVADYRARQACRNEPAEIREGVVDLRRDEIMADMMESPGKIPSTTMGNVAEIIAHVRRTVREAENIPFGEVAKRLETLALSDRVEPISM